MAVGDEGCCSNNAVKELINTTIALGSKKIDLSRKQLTEIPPEVLDLQQLEFLYLEGNFLIEIPHCLFERLPNLKWLDLRYNRITGIPSAIGSHKTLRNLLLEGNDITELPLELGFAKLSGLNIASNPLQMPPSSVIEKGTQAILKFLREKYVSKMQIDESQAVLGLRPESSSSEEELVDNGCESQIAAQLREEEKAPTHMEEVKVERVRLPPIFKAAADRPRNRTVDKSNEILRGQKSMQFEPKSKANVQISDPETRNRSPQKPYRYDEIRRNYSPPKKIPSEDGTNKRTTLSKTKKYASSYDAVLKGGFEELQDYERMVEKTEKRKKKRKSRSQSPVKGVSQPSKNQAALNQEKSQIVKHKENVTQVTTKDDQNIAKDIESTVISNAQKRPDEPESSVQEIRDTTKLLPNNPAGLLLKEGDFVAIKVPSKLYIKGQPCLGKITTLEDNLGLLTVHYYTGSYEGYWRPMMSRTSPYLRKVPQQSVLCKFKLSGDGRMSPMTRAKVKKVVDGEKIQKK